jgi:DNA modification methylase
VEKIEQVSIELLIPYANNARTHSDAQVAQIAASIREFGFTNPVLTSDDNTIIAGHGRVMAARKLGLTQVPVIRLSHLSETQRKAYILADNKLALNAGWDDNLLSIELADLKDLGFDTDLTGFSADEIAALMPVEVTEGLTDEDEVPEAPIDPVTKLGDVWLLGKHRLMCGDSTSIEAFDQLMAGERADMIFTDPPYGMSYGGGRAAGDHALDKKTGGVKIKSHGMILNDDLQGEDLIALVRDAIATSTASMKEGGALYACFTWRTYAEFEAGLESCGHKVKACIVWDKKSIGLGNSNYRPQHEFIFYCGGQWYGDKSESDVWYLSRGNTGAYVHPTQKPVELIERAIDNSSKRGDLIIDCFGGSGSTLVACEKTGRQARLMELDPKYCDVIVKRWQDFTGKQATLEATGDTFSQLSDIKNARQAA